MKTTIQLALALLLCAMLTSCDTFRYDGSPDVTVAADRTDAGKKYTPPTTEKPQYYALLSIGSMELGAVYAGEAPPPAQTDVEPLIVATLEKQHFHRATNSTPAPNLIIIYAWGSINPDELALDPDPDMPPTQLNTGQMLGIVSTNKDDTTPGSFDRNYNLPDLSEGRHFLLIGAYDYATFPFKNPKQKRPILWRAKLSVPNSSTTLAEAIPTLLQIGGDFLGQDGPSTTLAAKVRKGTVELGETKVVEEDVKTGTKPGDKKMPDEAKPSPEKTPDSQ